MKLLRNYMVLGGQIGLYDDTRSKTAKFDIKLTVEGATDRAAIARLGADLAAIAKSISDLSEQMLAESAFSNHIKTDKEARRKEFLASRKSKLPMDNTSDDRYPEPEHGPGKTAS